jgi:hypothetical protein
MWWNRKTKLQHLSDELRGIALLDRLYASRTDLTQDDRYAHAMRQMRQSELLAEMERLTAKKRPRISLDGQKPARSRQEIPAEAAREQGPVRLLARLEELKRALDERDGKGHRDSKSPAAAA